MGSKCEDAENTLVIATPTEEHFVGGGSVMVWGGISPTGKIRFVIIGSNLNPER